MQKNNVTRQKELRKANKIGSRFFYSSVVVCFLLVIYNFILHIASITDNENKNFKDNRTAYPLYNRQASKDYNLNGSLKVLRFFYNFNSSSCLYLIPRFIAISAFCSSAPRSNA